MDVCGNKCPAWALLAIGWIICAGAKKTASVTESLFTLKPGSISGQGITVLANTTKVSLSRCAFVCNAVEECDGANFHKGNRTCLMLSWGTNKTEPQSADNEWMFLAKQRTKYQGSKDYPTSVIDGTRWRPFWWFKAGTPWPSIVSDVFQDEYGSCAHNATYCFGRLPASLKEDQSELLAEDSAGTVYRWKFDSSNSVAHATWQAFQDRVACDIQDGDGWMPTVVSGKNPTSVQDSVLYKEVYGVTSYMIDDNGCNCMSTLNMGHSICTFGLSKSEFGVELLDSGCDTPNNRNGLTLYFKDDDDCTGVSCPIGKRCRDDFHTHVCE